MKNIASLYDCKRPLTSHNVLTLLLFGLFLSCSSCKEDSPSTPSMEHTVAELELLDKVQRETFNYFWDGGEILSGAARERIHMDGIYPDHDEDIVTSGGTGFGIMATIVAIERNFITRNEGYHRLLKLSNWLRDADRFHGAWPHWMHPDGKTKPFSQYDDGGDLVETAFLVQGLIVAREYFKNGNSAEKKLASDIDKLWKGVDWQWYTRGQDVLYWHWSPNFEWKMNFAVRGYNECTIMYILGIASPTHAIPTSTWHKGYMRNGDITADTMYYGLNTILDHYDTADDPVGPLFWAHYSFMGLNPRGLKDRYADYWKLNVHHAKIHHFHASQNPSGYKGYSDKCWGMTSSYSMSGYSTHMPTMDLGVISPTAAISSMPYAPAESLAFLQHLYLGHPEYIGVYGPYDAFSEQSDWYLTRYLAIDQLPIPVMIENYRTGLIWHLFMNAPEIQEALRKLEIKQETTEPLRQ